MGTFGERSNLKSITSWMPPDCGHGLVWSLVLSSCNLRRLGNNAIKQLLLGCELICDGPSLNAVVRHLRQADAQRDAHRLLAVLKEIDEDKDLDWTFQSVELD